MNIRIKIIEFQYLKMQYIIFKKKYLTLSKYIFLIIKIKKLNNKLLKNNKLQIELIEFNVY